MTWGIRLGHYDYFPITERMEMLIFWNQRNTWHRAIQKKHELEAKAKQASARMGR